MNMTGSAGPLSGDARTIAEPLEHAGADKNADEDCHDTAAEMKTLALAMHRADYGTPVPMSDRGTSAEPYADNPAKAHTMRAEGWGR